MNIEEHASLKPYNTLALDAAARYLITVTSLDLLCEAIHFANAKKLPYLVLGEGSNIVLRGNIDKVVILMRTEGVSIDSKGHDSQVFVTAQAGETWHPFVQCCLSKGLYGIENLSLIPGTVGAAPVQNIGAYGVELADVLHSLKVYAPESQETFELTREDCRFGYRDSLFKQRQNTWIITEVTLCLSTRPAPKTSYGDILEELDAMKADGITPSTVAEAICRLRQRKLPTPSILPNAGSFFKNPVITQAQFKLLQAEFPTIVHYVVSDQHIKLAAGWMIEQCGLKGKRLNDAGVHTRQALVLVNHGNATGTDILALAEEIQDQVKSRFGICLDIEPTVT